MAGKTTSPLAQYKYNKCTSEYPSEIPTRYVSWFETYSTIAIMRRGSLHFGGTYAQLAIRDPAFFLKK